ncbi:MAG: pyruvate, phosphate dikinase [Acidobacteria bacterium]|nr:MAG: pyruvate, phosphate dikinase [Acidobacteriota bacterium]
MADYVYTFAAGKAMGHAGLKDLLGGKGANLAEMCGLGIPVPPGFTITTEVCTHFHSHGGRYPDGLQQAVERALDGMAELMGARFGDPAAPLLVSVRSGARSSMPGMMETVLNVGLTSRTLPALVAKTGNPRFVYDAYRRLIAMYADVVMEKAEGIEPEEGEGIREQLDRLLEAVKSKHGYATDADVEADQLEALCAAYRARVKEVLGKPFPDDPHEQLWGAIGAVFRSWNGKRAVHYRRIEGIPDHWGTAVNVQAMVFGNMGPTSATGVAFTRNPATGEATFYGEWLPNAQGEDVVAGIRTPYALNDACRTDVNRELPTLEEAMPAAYRELVAIRDKLERRYRDMQDIEFTIQEERLWMLQTRTGKRNGPAALRMAVEMVDEGLIDRREAIRRLRPEQLDELLHARVDPQDARIETPIARGLPAGPGGACGIIVLTADRAEALGKEGRQVILVRAETSPEDVHGMHAAQAIVTARGGMTSHAALVARGWGKTCVVGCGELDIDLKSGTIQVGNVTLREGDWLTVDGTRGQVYAGKLKLIESNPGDNPQLAALLAWCDEVRRLGVRTNADSPEDAAQARRFGAEGIGLCRTEHMFFDETRIQAMREMILADREAERARALEKLLPYQKEDFKGILRAMDGLPVTVRLLDPPLHEFMHLDDKQIAELAAATGKSVEAVRARLESLHEANPMLGHRGCRLGISYPEITRMQARAILEAAAELRREGVDARPEIMVPLVGAPAELRHQKKVILEVAAEVKAETGDAELPVFVGTMIEVPRATLLAAEIAAEADFFSFGTNDLTQLTCGFSRDDVGTFLPLYLEQEIYPEDPFASLDQTGVGQLVELATERGRGARPELKVGICGEHGGDPASIAFFHRAGLDYVSCSPYRVPIARLAAAQSALDDG